MLYRRQILLLLFHCIPWGITCVRMKKDMPVIHNHCIPQYDQRSLAKICILLKMDSIFLTNVSRFRDQALTPKSLKLFAQYSNCSYVPQAKLSKEIYKFNTYIYLNYFYRWINHWYYPLSFTPQWYYTLVNMQRHSFFFFTHFTVLFPLSGSGMAFSNIIIPNMAKQ